MTEGRRTGEARRGYERGMVDAFRRISHSLFETALITGVLVRVLHVVFVAHGAAFDWRAFLATILIVQVVVAAMATVHLANYPVPQWLWRAPVFALTEAVVEAFTSLALISMGRERWGTGRATMAEWPAIAGRILVWRFATLCLFAFVLGAIVQWYRRRELSAERQHHHPHGPPSSTPERRRTPT